MKMTKNTSTTCLFFGALLLLLTVGADLVAANEPIKPYNQSVLLNNQQQIVPLKSLETRKTAVLSLKNNFDAFRDQMNRYATTKYFEIPTETSAYHALDEQLKLFNTVVFALSPSDAHDARLISFLQHQAVGKDVIVVLAGAGS